MGLYHEGYEAALHRLDGLDDAGLYGVLDDLFGRDNLPDDPTREDLLLEAQQQTRREFRDDSDPGWATVDFFTGLHQLQSRTR